MARLGTTSRHATYACGVGVMRLLLSFLRRDAARVHIILTYHRQRRCPVAWTLLVVTIPLNYHLGLFSFTCTRGWPIGVRAHHHLTYPCTRRALTWMDILLTYHRQRRCPVAWTLLVVTNPLNYHLGLFSFTCTRGWPIGVRARHHLTYPCIRRALTWMAR